MTTARHQLPQWQALAQHQRALAPLSMTQLFEADAQRAAAMTFEVASLRLDLSRHRANHDTLRLLMELARAVDIEGEREALFSGALVNSTEQRAATHTALRAQPQQERDFLRFAEAVRHGHIHGHTHGHTQGRGGASINTVVCLGIGGSDLGPRLVTQALTNANSSSALRVRFVTNLDPVELDQALADATPARTLVLAISKSFSTLETLENLRAALTWLRPGVDDLGAHVVAVTSQPERAIAFAREQGFTLNPAAIFTFDDTIGGRYSVWSACGLPIALAHGAATFQQLLAGAATMDQHFRTAPLERNVPVLLGLLAIWYSNFWGVRTRAVMPYARRLRSLTSYLQQLEMESTGKRVDRHNAALEYDTVPVVWGDVGSTAQHSVFQFLHQGTHWVPVDFITSARFAHSAEPRERLLYLNAVAQADALAFGDEALPRRATPAPAYAVVPGNRPSTFIELADIDATALGALIALYEHRTFVTSVLWNINAFDQWGVEIGKKLLAQRLQKKESS